jgi:hypothetical protein
MGRVAVKCWRVAEDVGAGDTEDAEVPDDADDDGMMRMKTAREDALCPYMSKADLEHCPVFSSPQA